MFGERIIHADIQIVMSEEPVGLGVKIVAIIYGDKTKYVVLMVNTEIIINWLKNMKLLKKR
jgi:hypothetical protein